MLGTVKKYSLSKKRDAQVFLLSIYQNLVTLDYFTQIHALNI